MYSAQYTSDLPTTSEIPKKVVTTSKLPKSTVTTHKLPVSNDVVNNKSYDIVDKLGLNSDKIGNQALTYNQRFNRNSMGISVDEMIDKLNNKGLLKNYKDKINDIDILYAKGEGAGVIHHDVSHVERVMLYSMYMGDELGLSAHEMNMLSDAAKYHDIGVFAGHSGHSIRSAQSALENLNKSYSKDDLNKIAAIIEYHELNDSLENFNFIMNKYNISSSDSKDVLKIANILKDADAIDRTRFANNLDTRYFRNKDQANNLVKASYQMQEIQAKQILDEKINNGSFNEHEIRDIMAYRNTGIPDYVIYESYSTYNGWGFSSPLDMIDYWMKGAI